MRSLFLSLIPVLVCASTQAQDPGMQAAQQAQQIQQQVQIATQAAQQANQQAMRDAQQASQNAAQASSAAHPCPGCVSRSPHFSRKSGTYSSPIQVTIKADRTAAIYYTLDGWTPTRSSELYTRPIDIDSTAKLQAIAVSPRGLVSQVTFAEYHLPNAQSNSVYPGTPPVEIPGAASAPGKIVIPKGIALPLVFASDVNAKDAKVGDKLSLTLAQDVISDGVILLTKGTLSFATVTEVDKPRVMGIPGEIFFQADSIQMGSETIKLNGSAAKQGVGDETKAALLNLGAPIGFFVHGQDAKIKQGAVFTAYVAEDTSLSRH